jgi:3-hydroxyanthranilate 3,4-dioxygenase
MTSKRPLPPINFRKWIEDHRDKLKPPVGNQLVYEDSEIIVMVVGGPNSRKDYHDDAGEEFFYQLEGDMILRTQQDGSPVDIPIREGEIFLLPPHMLHSPQRFENTVGLVIERKRGEDERDGFVWFCDECNTKLYEEYIPLKSIVTDLPVVFDRFWNSEAHRTCKSCGHIMPLPENRKKA